VREIDDDCQPAAGLATSPALSMVTENRYAADGRVVHVLATDGADLKGIRALRQSLLDAGVTCHVVAPHKGAITGGGRRSDELTVDRSFHTASSAEADAVVVAGGTTFADDPVVATYLQAAFRHAKPIAAWGDGVEVLERLDMAAASGVVTADKMSSAFTKSVVASLGDHRFWDRSGTHPTRQLLAAMAPAESDATNGGNS
jgi:catalase